MHALLYRHLRLLAVLTLLPGVTLHGADTDDLAALDQALQQWLTLHEAIRDSRQDWAREEAILRDEERLLEARLQLLREALAAQREAEERAGDEAQAAAATLAQARDAVSPVRELVSRHERRLDAWRADLPPFPRQRLAEALPAIPVETETNHGERLRALLDALAAAHAFARELHTGHAVLALPGEPERQMQLLFAGTAIGYAVTEDRSLAAICVRRADGWSWQPATEHAEAIAAAFAMVADGAPARLVRLPVDIGGAP